MDKEKEYVCGYQYCKHNGVKVPSDQAIKDGTRYYHQDCHIEKEQKQQIFDLYYKAYKSTEDYYLVRKAVSQLVNEQFYPSEFVLFALCQAIKQRIPFKGIFTLSYIVKNDMSIRKKYETYKAKETTKDFSFDDVNTLKKEIIIYKTSSDTSWENTLFS